MEVTENPNLEDKLELVESLAIESEDFKKNVVIPYFKDIFKDLAARSDDRHKGIHKIVLMEYANLPGILFDRFFALMNANKDGFVDIKNFMHILFKIYYSTLEQKIKFVFDIYDFDRDGFIMKEDIRIVMTFVPISVLKGEEKKSVHEGIFSQEGGGGLDFEDRVIAQEEIQNLLDFCFEDKEKIDLKDFMKINEEKSSEMLLCIMSVFREKLPCSDNYYRYLKNYEKILEQDTKKVAEKKLIASPKMLSRLSPSLKLSPRAAGGGAAKGLSIEVANQGPLLRYAAGGAGNEPASPAGTLRGVSDYKNQEEVKNAIQLDKLAGKNEKNEERKKRLEDTKTEDDSAPMVAVRFDSQKKPDQPKGGSSLLERLAGGPASQAAKQEEAKAPLHDEDLYEVKADTVHLEGEMYRKASESKLKKYWFSLLGKELYFYKHKNDEKHKGMLSLVGVYIKDELEEVLDKKTVLYPFKLIFPSKTRTYYLLKKTDKQQWMEAIKKAIGYADLTDFYELRGNLGKGKFGIVKEGLHKKTNKLVAIKTMKKKEMKPQDIELQKREIEILKICQHPNIIKLIDVFDSPDFIYIVMDYLPGGDLFSYLEKRKFKIPEDRARVIAHKIATALYYLHTFGIAHRDLKPENILMQDETDDSDLKLVDFGLSKIVGPSETCSEPFGTLSYVAPEVLLQKPYGKEVDIWSLGIIVYMMLSGVLPFDDDDDREIARQTIYDPPDFTYHTWTDVSEDCKDLVSKLLEKNRHKRIKLDKVLEHPWFAKAFKNISLARKNSGDFSEKFKTYTVHDQSMSPSNATKPQ